MKKILCVPLPAGLLSAQTFYLPSQAATVAGAKVEAWSLFGWTLIGPQSNSCRVQGIYATKDIAPVVATS